MVVVAAGWRTVQSLGAPSQVLQRLQEGAASPLLFQGRGALLLHLRYLRERDGLRLEAGLPGPAGAALAPGGALGDRQLLGELLVGRGQEVGRQEVGRQEVGRQEVGRQELGRQEVGRQEVAARGFHGPRTHSSH